MLMCDDSLEPALVLLLQESAESKQIKMFKILKNCHNSNNSKNWTLHLNRRRNIMRQLVKLGFVIINALELPK